MKVKTRTINERTALQVYEVGGRPHLLRAPFDPYFYAPVAIGAGENEQVIKTLLSTLQERKLWKVGFPNVYRLKRNRVSNGIEDNVPYDQRVAIDHGFKYPSGLPTHDAFDLEMESTEGIFPNAQRDRITAIGYEGEGFAKCKTIFDEPEYELIHWFIDTVRKRDPDLLDTYYGSFADWLWLITRAHKNEIRLAVGRDGSEPYVITRTYTKGKKIGQDNIIDIKGRVHFDVWKEVDADQTLFGIKNRQLKTVARWFGLSPVIEVDRTQMGKLKPEELRRYCQSDAYLTREEAKIYLRNLYPLADMLELPLNMTVNRNPSHPSNYVYMREFRQLGIVADKPNEERYPMFWRVGRKVCQGALINLFKIGLLYNLRHADFKSMYPSIMHCHNYSPEGLLVVNVRYGERQKEWVEYDGNTIRVYDFNVDGVIEIKVDLSHDSVSRRRIEEWMMWRAKIKREMEDKGYSEELQSQQWAIKVVMNAMTGYHGMRFARCGSVPIAAHITGHGRFWIDKTTDFLMTRAQPIERDTDGIYYTGDSFVDEINALILDLIPDHFNKSLIRVDEKVYPVGIFYEEKGYVLKKPNGKLIFHGSGLKGRHLPNVCDKVLQACVRGVFADDDIIGILHGFRSELKGLPRSDFIMTARLRKRPQDYSTKTQYGKIIERAKAHGIPIRWGDEVQYLKTTDRSYLPIGAKVDYKLDFEYYRGRIADVVSRILRVTHGYDRDSIVTYLGGKKKKRRKKRKCKKSKAK